MERITDRDVRRAFEEHVRALRQYPGLIDPEYPHIGLTCGSKTLGIAYRVWASNAVGGRSHYVLREDFLGFTAREAHGALIDRTRTIHALAQAWGIQPPEPPMA